MKLLRLSNSSPEITQADLENILSIEAQVKKLTRIRDQIAASVLRRFNAGAPAEPGPRTFDVEECYSGTTRKQRLIVR